MGASQWLKRTRQTPKFIPHAPPFQRGAGGGFKRFLGMENGELGIGNIVFLQI